MTQEDIPYTKEEIKAMVKTIAELREEEKELLNKVYDFIIANVYKYGKVKFVDNRATFDFRMNTFLNDLKQVMEE